MYDNFLTEEEFHYLYVINKTIIFKLVFSLDV